MNKVEDVAVGWGFMGSMGSMGDASVLDSRLSL